MLGIVGEGGAIAQTSTNAQLARVSLSARRGDCYVVETRSTPVFPGPDTTDIPRFDLREGETVYLLEDNKDYTVIRVEIPGERRDEGDGGYVRTDDLIPCRQSISTTTSVFSGCRLSLRGDRNRDFLEVYEGPSDDDNSRPNGRVGINDPVTIDDDYPAIPIRNQEWVKIRRPIEGWLINRFPRSRVDNLEGCNIIRR